MNSRPGLTVAQPLDEFQCGGSVTTSTDPVSHLDSITLTNGSLAGKTSCTINVNVVANSAGTYNNCIVKGALHNYQNATNADPTCDTLVVEQSVLPPSINKVFSPNPARTGATAGLTFTITNPNSIPLTGVTFTDNFPAGLSRASVPNASQCGGSVTSTASSVSLSGGTIPANASCTVTVGVAAVSGGTYLNTSDPVSSTNGGDRQHSICNADSHRSPDYRQTIFG